MAYVIGSKKGQDIAKSMAVGATYKASDGSVWTKKSDGSVSVTHNGVTTDNAYKQTSASTGKGTSSGSSSSKNKNNQYTQSSYTIGSDYGKQVAQNMGIGATFEATDGSVWKKENDGTITVTHNGQTYKNAYTPTDLGVLGTQQVQAGLPYQDVEKTYYDRLNKIANNPELAQYANDGTMQMLLNYINDQKKQETYEDNLEDFNEGRPDEYTNPYKKEIDFLLNQILNRDDFSYDAANDPLYQQYRDMYIREGDRAMKETMAEAAAGAGGMNTYAITAAQQAANYYNSQLNDRIPELYQLAYDMYLKDKESKVQDLGILQNMDQTQYNRYRDTMTDWQNDRNFALGVYNDAVAQGNWDKTFDYNAMLNNRDFGYTDYWNNKEWNYNDEWKNKEWEHGLDREQIEDTRYDENISREDRELAKEEVWKYIEMGVTPSADLIAKAGMTQSDVDLAVAAVKAEQAKKNTSSGGGGGGDDDTPYTPKKKEEEDDGYNPENVVSNRDKDVDEINWDAMSNYKPIDEACRELFTYKGKDAALAYLKEALETGAIDITSYMTLMNKYRNAGN